VHTFRKTANRHFLKSMARVGAGYEQFFDPKTKSKWQRKVCVRVFVCACFPALACMHVYSHAYMFVLYTDACTLVVT